MILVQSPRFTPSRGHSPTNRTASLLLFYKLEVSGMGKSEAPLWMLTLILLVPLPQFYAVLVAPFFHIFRMVKHGYWFTQFKAKSSDPANRVATFSAVAKDGEFGGAMPAVVNIPSATAGQSLALPTGVSSTSRTMNSAPPRKQYAASGVSSHDGGYLYSTWACCITASSVPGLMDKPKAKSRFCARAHSTRDTSCSSLNSLGIMKSDDARKPLRISHTRHSMSVYRLPNTPPVSGHDRWI